MAKKTSAPKSAKSAKSKTLQVRLDARTDRLLTAAAEASGMDLSTWVRSVAVRQAGGVGFKRERSFLPISVSVRDQIAPDSSVQITARPQVAFRGDRLAIWSPCAANFQIESIEVSRGSMREAIGVQAGAIPADAFATRLDLLAELDAKLDDDGVVRIELPSQAAQDYVGLQLAFPLCPAGSDIVVVVTNISAAPSPFVGMILGDAER